MLLTVFSIGQVWATDATMIAGTNGSSCTVNGASGIKVGTSSKGGDMTITVGAGATKLTLYAAAWKGVTGLSLNISGATTNPTSISLTADGGITSNSPFTLSGTASNFKHEITLSGITAETTITFTSSIAKRFVVWGAAYETSGGSTPSVSADPDEVTDVVAEGVTNQTIELTYENIENYETEVSVHPNADGTGTLSSAWLTASVSDVDDYATVTYSVAANDGDARTAYIKVYTTDGDKEATTIVPISQVKYSAPTGTFKLFSGDISEGDYVIYYGGKAMNTTVTSNRLQYLEVTPSDNKITNPDESIIWHIAPISETTYWSIYNATENKYAGGTTTSNQATMLSDVTSYASWAITGTSTYQFENYGRSILTKDADKKWLRNNGTYGFACYASSTGGTLTLYKLDDGTPSAPTFSPAGGSFLEAQNVTLSAESGTTIYYTTDGTAPSTSSSVYSAAIPVGTTTTIKAIAVKDDKSSGVASATYTIISVDHAGTAADPYSVADARTVIDAGIGLADKYVRGIVSEIVDAYSSTYFNISYNISDDGLTTSNQLEAYRGKSYNGGNFTSNDDIQVGDDVIVFGTLKKYGSTYELDTGNQLVKRSAHLAWSGTTEGAYAASLEGGSTFPTLTNSDDVSVSYSSSETSVATINASNGNIDLVGAGSTNITATFTGNDTYFEKSASYTLNVSSTVIKADILFEENGGSAVTDMQAQSNLPSPLPTTTKAGYNFGGWFTTSTFDAGTEAIAGAAVTSSDPITLYAKWLDPYSVGVALTMINALADNEKTDNVYVIGVVDNHATSLSSTSINYNIKDANASNTLAVYKGKGLKTDLAPTGEDVTSADYVQEGDQVVVYGQLYKYVDKNSNTTPEIAQGSYILSKVRPTTAVTGVTLPETATVRAGKTIALTATIEPSNASNKNVTWSVIAGSDYAEVDANGVVTGKAQGTATIQVETEDGGFTATCEVTVAAAAPTFDDPDHEWIKVSNDAKLVAGRYYVIASDEKDKVAGTTLTSGYLADVSASFSDGVIAYNGFGSSKAAIAGGVAVFELGGEAGAWTLTEVSEEKVLTGATTQNLAWDGANNRTWAITISDGVATIGAAAGYYIRHNYSSNRFKPYSGTQTSMKVPQLYMWAELSHIVSFDANGGVAESVPEVERTDEGKIIIPAKTPTHTDAAKVFGGWYVTSAPGTLYNVGDEFSTDADVTLYAKWNSVPTHTVTYVPGGTGTGIPAVTSYAEGVKVKVVTVTDLANPGYLFTGWVVKDADQNVIDVDENNEFIMPTSNVTITAGWERQSSQKWALVKQGEELELNAEYVIACTSKSVALGTINTGGSTHYGNSVEVAINGEILKGSSAMVAFTLVAGNADDSYAFKNGNNYLMWSSGNSLDEKMTLDNSSSWTIEVGEDDVAAIANIGTSGRALKYNSGSPRFACYTSGQTVVQLYKKVLAATVTASDATEASVPDNADVTVKDGGVLTINNEKTIGDLIIEQGGKVVLDEKKLTVVGVFSIETTMGSGASGQLNGVTVANFEASEAYIDITLGDNANPNKWHAFTVPFPVDVLNGIYDLADNKLQNEVNYAIMDYHGDIRATGKYGWKKYRATLVPGTFYIMATDGYRTTYRFKKADGAALVAANTKDLHEYPLNGGTDEQHDNGWNGVGNPTLHYGTANQVVQVLNPNTYTYEEFLIGAKNFVVGTPFFVQAAADGTMTFSAEDKTKPYYAPARYSSEEIKDVEVRFGNEEYTDRLYISANEDALNTYETGKDLIKMTMTNTPKVAQIFGNAYNSKLCMVNAPLHNDQAIYSLTLYAPTDGEYTIAIPQVENADIYLTYDNRIIWNIAASEYNCELKAGETNNYGLILRMKAPQVTTGVEQGGVRNGANSVQKIIINDHVYILRGEKLYNVTGKMLR